MAGVDDPTACRGRVRPSSGQAGRRPPRVTARTSRPRWRSWASTARPRPRPPGPRARDQRHALGLLLDRRARHASAIDALLAAIEHEIAELRETAPTSRGGLRPRPRRLPASVPPPRRRASRRRSARRPPTLAGVLGVQTMTYEPGQRAAAGPHRGVARHRRRPPHRRRPGEGRGGPRPRRGPGRAHGRRQDGQGRGRRRRGEGLTCRSTRSWSVGSTARVRCGAEGGGRAARAAPAAGPLGRP